LTVRLATPGDIPAIQTLEKEADTAAHWSDDIYRSIFAAAAIERVLLVADHNGSISGFIVARVVSHEWEIENVVVATTRRRRGVASALMQNLVERARAKFAHQIMLEVRESNISARSLYAKHGFVECGGRERYYQDPAEDAVCYRLELSSKFPQP